MKIDTIIDGQIEVPKVLKYFNYGGRKIAVHRAYVCREFTNDYFTCTDYLTGCSFRTADSIKEAIELTKKAIDNNLNFDYSKYEVINS